MAQGGIQPNLLPEYKPLFELFASSCSVDNQLRSSDIPLLLNRYLDQNPKSRYKPAILGFINVCSSSSSLVGYRTLFEPEELILQLYNLNLKLVGDERKYFLEREIEQSSLEKNVEDGENEEHRFEYSIDLNSSQADMVPLSQTNEYIIKNPKIIITPKNVAQVLVKANSLPRPEIPKNCTQTALLNNNKKASTKLLPPSKIPVRVPSELGGLRRRSQSSTMIPTLSSHSLIPKFTPVETSTSLAPSKKVHHRRSESLRHKRSDVDEFIKEQPISAQLLTELGNLSTPPSISGGIHRNTSPKEVLPLPQYRLQRSQSSKSPLNYPSPSCSSPSSPSPALASSPLTSKSSVYSLGLTMDSPPISMSSSGVTQHPRVLELSKDHSPNPQPITLNNPMRRSLINNANYTNLLTKTGIPELPMASPITPNPRPISKLPALKTWAPGILSRHHKLLQLQSQRHRLQAYDRREKAIVSPYLTTQGDPLANGPLAQIKLKVRALDHNRNLLYSRNQESSNKVDELTKRYAIHAADHREANDKLSHFTAKIADLTKAVRAAEAFQDEVEEETISLTKQIGDLEHSINRLLAANDRLKQIQLFSQAREIELLELKREKEDLSRRNRSLLLKAFELKGMNLRGQNNNKKVSVSDIFDVNNSDSVDENGNEDEEDSGALISPCDLSSGGSSATYNRFGWNSSLQSPSDSERQNLLNRRHQATTELHLLKGQLSQQQKQRLSYQVLPVSPTRKVMRDQATQCCLTSLHSTTTKEQLPTKIHHCKELNTKLSESNNISEEQTKALRKMPMVEEPRVRAEQQPNGLAKERQDKITAIGETTEAVKERSDLKIDAESEKPKAEPAQEGLHIQTAKEKARFGEEETQTQAEKEKHIKAGREDLHTPFEKEEMQAVAEKDNLQSEFGKEKLDVNFKNEKLETGLDVEKEQVPTLAVCKEDTGKLHRNSDSKEVELDMRLSDCQKDFDEPSISVAIKELPSPVLFESQESDIPIHAASNQPTIFSSFLFYLTTILSLLMTRLPLLAILCWFTTSTIFAFFDYYARYLPRPVLELIVQFDPLFRGFASDWLRTFRDEFVFNEL